MNSRTDMKKCLILILSSLFFYGCNAEEARAPRTPVTAMQLRNFGVEDIKRAGGSLVLKNNKFFMWKKGATPEDRARASEIAKKIDGYDEVALQLGKRQESLRTMPVLEPCIEAQEKLPVLIEERAKRIKQKESEESKAKPDPKKLKRFIDQIAKADENIKAVSQALLDFQDLEKPTGKLFREFLKNEEDLAQNSAEGNLAVDQMTQLVDWSRNQPDLVSFVFQADGTIAVQVRTWSLPSEADGVDTRNYSTEDGSIVNVQYEESGGRLIFDVRIFIGEGDSKELRETYRFDIRRSNYVMGDVKERLYFSGEIIRERDQGYCERRFSGFEDSEALAQCLEVRKGWAKLVSVNN